MKKQRSDYMKAKDIQLMGKHEIEEKLVELKQELSKERATISSGTKSEHPGKIKNLRKDIARLFTILKTKKENK